MAIFFSSFMLFRLWPGLIEKKKMNQIVNNNTEQSCMILNRKISRVFPNARKQNVGGGRVQRNSHPSNPMSETAVMLRFQRSRIAVLLTFKRPAQSREKRFGTFASARNRLLRICWHVGHVSSNFRASQQNQTDKRRAHTPHLDAIELRPIVSRTCENSWFVRQTRL